MGHFVRRQTLGKEIRPEFGNLAALPERRGLQEGPDKRLADAVGSKDQSLAFLSAQPGRAELRQFVPNDPSPPDDAMDPLTRLRTLAHEDSLDVSYPQPTGAVISRVERGDTHYHSARSPQVFMASPHKRDERLLRVLLERRYGLSCGSSCFRSMSQSVHDSDQRPSLKVLHHVQVPR